MNMKHPGAELCFKDSPQGAAAQMAQACGDGNGLGVGLNGLGIHGRGLSTSTGIGFNGLGTYGNGSNNGTSVRVNGVRIHGNGIGKSIYGQFNQGSVKVDMFYTSLLHCGQIHSKCCIKNH